jgi:cytochrome c556
MRLSSLLVAVGLAALPAIPSAQSADDVIAARRGFFQLVGLNFGPLVAMARGDTAYDAGMAEANAANLSALTFYAIPGLFAGGTSNADKPGATRAQPAIWTSGDDVAAKIADFKNAVGAMQTAAPMGRAELAQAVSALGGTCQACHDNYRARNF